MYGCSLKHFDKYRKSIDAYAKAHRLKIRYDRRGYESSFVPSLRVIKIEPHMSDSEEIATLLHELGHSIDDMLVVNGTMSRRMDKAYKSLYKNRASKVQKAMVYGAESRAWNLGRVIARELNIRLGKWYTSVEQFSLKTYDL